MASRPNQSTNQDLVDIVKDIFKYNLKEPYQNRHESSHREPGCQICAVPDIADHQSTLKHRFNFLLWEWKKYRRSLVKNRNGIEITVTPRTTIDNLKYIERKETGSHILLATPQQAVLMNSKFTFHVEMKNTGSNSIILLGFDLLYPHESYRLDDHLNLMNNENVLELEQGAVYYFNVHVELGDSYIGCFKMPLIFHFLSKTLQNNPDFDIMRQVVVNISDDAADLIQLPKVKRIKAIFENVKNTVPPIDATRPTKYQIQPQHRAVLAIGLNEDRATTSAEISRIKQIKRLMRLDHIDRSNYDNFFHFVLWMDEIGEELALSRYNMGKVILIAVEEKCFELQVDGLAEKRPSLLRNDIVNIKKHGSSDTVYQGKIMKLFDTKIHIGSLNPRFYNILIANPAMEVDISFQPNRVTYERMHIGIQYIAQKPYILSSLFPNELGTTSVHHGGLKINNEQDVYNKEILDNPHQIQAVENIVNATSGSYPYIVFGPPGTGKTITIVEAILQIKKKVVNCSILVCAPANAACNMIASKLIQCCKTTELIRVLASSNPWDSVPHDLKPYCNWKNGDYLQIRGEQLQKYRIVITTLAMSGKYLTTKNFCPQYIFIDEAAQAAEPEAAMAIALLSTGFQLVLAGDPKQLGPIVVSKAAKQYRLDLSLLERLMSNKLYVNQNPNFITMLKLNFRAHPQVLDLANKIFYNNQLKAVSAKALNDPIASICIYSKLNSSTKKKQDQKCRAAVEFYAVYATEQREQRNPSYFNPEEVTMVEKTVVALCKLNETKVEQDDIGVITPYNSQVYRIKRRLADRGLTDVEVGSTETFQGREKRIIIISTVRAQKSLLHYDAKYKLGFIHSPQRFNVAVTRAMSKLIVIGCPNVLRYDPHYWLKYMDYCKSCNSYFGAPFDRRTEETMTEVVSRFNQIKSGRG